MELMDENMLTISSNGVLYSNKKRGVIPEVLEEWFAKRKEYKTLMKKYEDEGNEDLYSYYDRRQHIQKIFLNSLYGVLGLPVFRFYDVDNAAAVTLSGQEVIKSSSKFVNHMYNKVNSTDTEIDYCIYIDTDSLYFPGEPMFSQWSSSESKKDPLRLTINTAEMVETKLNAMYDVMAKKMFNCDVHKLFIKGESVASTGFWVTKKRYALNKVYDLELHKSVDKIVVKGLDVVRSTFPVAFREFTSILLKDILNKTSQNIIDRKILDFRDDLNTKHFLDIARNTSANNISKFFQEGTINQFKKGTPIHIKAAIFYNKLLKNYGLESQYAPIADGEKIKYVYLKSNPYKTETIAIRGYHDPPEIIKFIETYIDTTMLFEKELGTKLQDFYTALNWGLLPTQINQNSCSYFTFD
jgi:DNA polymerase elongation subunit (family B)